MFDDFGDKEEYNESEESISNDYMDELNYLNDIKNKYNTKSGNEFYIPSFAAVTGLYGPKAGVVFGLIFRLSKKYGHSIASVRYIAGNCGISPSTAGDTIKLLLKEFLIVDVTPEEKQYWKKGSEGIMKQVRYYVYNPERYAEIIDDWRYSPKNPQGKRSGKSSVDHSKIKKAVEHANKSRK